jgi:small subunit ribosomal protein S9
MADFQYYEGIGRRKSSSARARIYPGGAGQVVVNDRPGADYFPREGDMQAVLQPLHACGCESTVNLSVHVQGGGITGQSEAVRHAVARALLKLDETHRKVLRQHGFLTRDAREKERKKPGLKRARKAPTYTKR